MVTLEDILKIDNCDLYFFDHYKEDKPLSNHLYWGELQPVYSPRKDGKITKDIVQDRLINPEWKNNDLYLICKYMQYGDYDDSCMVERSNYKLFLEEYEKEPGVFTISGGYGSSGIAISIQYLLNPDNEEKALEIIELLNGLNDYPCINDEDMSNMEYEAFNEAFEDYGYKDAMTALSKKFNLEIYDYKEEEFKALLLEKASRCNPSWVIESGGSCYIDIDQMIKDVTLEELKPLLTEYEVRT